VRTSITIVLGVRLNSVSRNCGLRNSSCVLEDLVKFGRSKGSAMVVMKVVGKRVRLGGESHNGWLPEGASTPVRTPVRHAVVDVTIEHDSHGFLLICAFQEHARLMGYVARLPGRSERACTSAIGHQIRLLEG
jgi:hypothetical protein